MNLRRRSETAREGLEKLRNSYRTLEGGAKRSRVTGELEKQRKNFRRRSEPLERD